MDYENILKEQFGQVTEGADLHLIQEEASRLSGGLSDSFTLENILNAAVHGENLFSGGQVISGFTSLILYEIRSGLVLAAEILSICIIIGMLRSLSDGFGSKSVSRLSMLVCTMTITGISIESFRIGYQMILDAVSTMVWTMEVLAPVLIGLLISTGNIASGTVLNPVITGAAAGFGFFIQKIILPALFLSTVLILLNCLTEKDYVNRLANLIRSSAVFLTGLLLTLLTGIITIQGLLTESSDGLLINTAKYSLSSFIPIVGGFTSDTVELFLRCMGTIKSIIGIFGILMLVLMMAVPLLKALILGGIYKLTAALVEPVSHRRVADSLSDMGSSVISMASVLFFTSLLFIIFLTVIMKIGGG